MSPSNEELYQKRIAELEAENARLPEILDEVKADRRQMYGPVPEKYLPSEEELIEAMRNHVPGSGARLLTELGITLLEGK
jgi:hypothetical protein